MGKPVVLIILTYYLPGQRGGGPIRTTANMVEALGDEFDFRILTTDRDFGDDAPYPNVEPGEWTPVDKASVRYLSPAEQPLAAFRRILAATPYDLLYLDSVFTNSTIKTLLLYRLRLVPRKPVILAPRGHLNPGALSLKSPKKRSFLTVANLVGLYARLTWHVSGGSEKQDVLREFPRTNPARVHVIANLPSLALDRADVRPSPKQPGSLRLVFLSRISRKKNLHFALSLLDDLPGAVEFDIYGPLEDQAYWQECLALIAALPATVQVAYRGALPFDQVVAAFASYHLFFFPTLGENFGHVILEALCAGCPVLTSDQTIWGDLAAQGAGWAFPLDQPDAFRQALAAMLALDQTGFSDMARRALAYGARYLDDPARLAALRQLFHTVLQQGD